MGTHTELYRTAERRTKKIKTGEREGEYGLAHAPSPRNLHCIEEKTSAVCAAAAAHPLLHLLTSLSSNIWGFLSLSLSLWSLICIREREIVSSLALFALLPGCRLTIRRRNINPTGEHIEREERENVVFILCLCVKETSVRICRRRIRCHDPARKGGGRQARRGKRRTRNHPQRVPAHRIRKIEDKIEEISSQEITSSVKDGLTE